MLLPFNTMAEICIFLMFGLLVNPSSLLPALPVGLITAAVLMLVVRPISVLMFQPLSPFRWQDRVLVSWCGLRRAVPLALSYSAVDQISHLGVSTQAPSLPKPTTPKASGSLWC